LVSFLLVGSLLFLLFGGSRIAAVGKGLGEGVRHIKRALGDGPPEPLPPEIEVSKPREPKLLPAKGESSAPKDESS